MIVEALPDLIRQIDPNKIALLAISLPPLAHIIIRSIEFPESLYVVKDDQHLSEDFEEIGKVLPGELTSRHPTKNPGEDWVAGVHDHNGGIWIGNLPTTGIIILNSAQLSPEDAIKLGENMGLYTVNETNLKLLTKL